MSTYSAVLFVHVLAGIVLVGNSLLAPIVRNITCEASGVDALLRALNLERRTTRWNPAAALVLLASGIYLGSAGWWAEPWFHTSVAAWLANSFLAARVVMPLNARLVMAATQPSGPDVKDIERARASQRWNLSLAVMLANDLAILYLMFTKLGWPGSIGVIGATNVVVTALFVKTRPQPARLVVDAI